MSEFNLFGPATTNDIKVAYISTERGLVENVTVCEANDYAQLNPGTQFIFQTREITRYMNINGVNKLTPDDMMPQKTCEGIETDKECGPPAVHFSGGGGIGVKANPVIGRDGAVLAIDVVSGGFGYQYPPIVEVKDNCGIGAGGFFRSEVGEIAEQWEYYDQEEDFEDYELCENEWLDDVYGQRWGVDGQDLGKWEPKIYANLSKDPIRREIKEYQDFLQNYSTPWWTTRKEDPLTVTGEKGTSRQKYDVDHPAWGEFTNKYAISPKPKSNAPGSDFAGIPYSFVWEEDFPYDGEYVFRGTRDNKAEFYLDGNFISKLDNYKGSVNPIKKTIKAGTHEIRLDLLNIPVMEKVVVQQKSEEQTQVAGVDFVKKSKGYYMTVGGNDEVEVSLKLWYNDSPNIAGLAVVDVIIPNPNGKDLVLKREGGLSNPKKKGSVSAAAVFKKNELGYGPIQFVGNVRDPILQKKNLAYGEQSTKYGELKFIDNHGNDTNALLSILAAKNLQESRVKVSPPPKGSTDTQNIETHKVFNTIDYINKANRQLWRTNVYSRGGFINQYGICPFDTKLNLDNNPYAGTHQIVWDNVDFPIDGNYNIGIQVDDNVTLTISGGGKEEVIRKVGFAGDTNASTGKSDYVRRFKKGSYKITADLEQIPGGRFSFKQEGRSKKLVYDVNFNVTSAARNAVKIIIREVLAASKDYKGQQINQIITRQIEAGKEYEVEVTGMKKSGTVYATRLRTRSNGKQLQAEDGRDGDFNDLICSATEGKFYEIKGNKCKFRVDQKPAKGINPMALAVNIETAFTEKEVISAKSWNENPMGVSLTIDAPEPPIPTEPEVAAAGRCPRNPMWSTRHPGKEKWYPVRFDGWSGFFNRYALSPVAPSGQADSDSGGSTYENSWSVDIPYNGWYKLRAEVDDICKIWVDDDLKIDLSRRKDKIRGQEKFYLSQGDHDIRLEVENYKSQTFRDVDQKIFHTADWAVKQEKVRQTGTEEITFKVSSAADFANGITIDGILSESKTYKGAQINRTITEKVEIGKVYDVTLTSSNRRTQSTGAGISGLQFINLHPRNNPIKVTNNRTRLALKDEHGNDTNSSFTIDRVSGGTAKFSSNGKNIETKGDKVDVTLTLSWNDNPNPAQAVNAIKISDRTWTQTGKRGSQTHTVTLMGVQTTKGGNLDSNIRLRTKGQNVLQMEEWTDNDWQDIVCAASKGKFYEFKGNKCKYVLEGDLISKGSLSEGSARGGVTYEGPALATYRGSDIGALLSPVWEDDLDFRKNLQDNEWTSTWSNVNFPEDGQYKVECMADDTLSIKIDGQEVATAKVGEKQRIREQGTETTKFSSIKTIVFNATKGKRTISATFTNIAGNSGSTFATNPVVFGFKITKKVKVGTGKSKSWVENPIGVSAVLIPPPCPKKVKGKGTVTRVIPIDPGNGFPKGDPEAPYPNTGGGGDYPVGLALTAINIEDPGINYDCSKDKVTITPSYGAELSLVCDNFGRISEVKVDKPGIFDGWPNIEIESDTGVNFTATPVFDVIRDPIVTSPDRLIQVTDLVGLKKTGYYKGRPYYGAVFYKNGIRYAGWYETPGELVQIYNTLQESIDAEVTTPPSAIQKQGSDVSSDNPRLDIPGTPDNLT